jgi:ComF family protein
MEAGLSGIRSVGPFDGWLRDAILNFKYYDEWARVEQLGECLARIVVEMEPAGAMVPVPLHPTRLRARGYNQSALLAKVLSDSLGVPMVEAASRIRATDQQARLSGAQRVANVDGAFAVRPGFDPAGMHLILVDDVITTGATINACARALVAGGAASVRAVTLARQLDHKSDVSSP